MTFNLTFKVTFNSYFWHFKWFDMNAPVKFLAYPSEWIYHFEDSSSLSLIRQLDPHSSTLSALQFAIPSQWPWPMRVDWGSHIHSCPRFYLIWGLGIQEHESLLMQWWYFNDKMKIVKLSAHWWFWSLPASAFWTSSWEVLAQPIDYVTFLWQTHPSRTAFFCV